MRDEAAEPVTGKPGMEMKRRRLDPQRGRMRGREIEIDRGIGRGADACRNSSKHRRRRPLDVASRNHAGTRVAREDLRKADRGPQILASPGGERAADTP